MNKDNEHFDKMNYCSTPLKKGEYVECTFTHCDFSQSTLAGCKFIECTFIQCNLSVTKLTDTALRNVHFKNCKMLGLRFDECAEFGFSVSFDGCMLNMSSFYKCKLYKTLIANSQLRDVDFTESNLTSSIFDNCDLALAIFERTIIEKADLSTSFNYAFDPENNRIKKAIFTYPGVLGLLMKYDIEIDKGTR